MDFELYNKHYAYDPINGVLYNKKRNMRPVGYQDSLGYILVRFEGKLRKAHRICYLLYHGYVDSQKVIDHINGVRADNRIENLRLVTQQINSTNCISDKQKRPNLGVTKRGNRWGARIYYSGKSYWLGSFETKEEALTARELGEERFDFYS